MRSIALSFRSVAKDLKGKRETALIERARSFSDAESSKNRIRTDSDATKEFDGIARRHFRGGALPTLPSEENIAQLDEDDNENHSQVNIFMNYIYASYLFQTV